MKLFSVLLIILSSLAVADNDGNFGSSSSAGVQEPGCNDISLTLVNDWTLSEKALGLDVFFTASEVFVLGADNNLDILRVYDVTGTPCGSITLTSANGSCFGVAWNNDLTNGSYYTNDWVSSNLFYTDNFGSTWTTVPNPAGTNGRGMDFDGVNYWETNGNGGGVWRFNPGVGQENLPLSEPPTALSGLTVFPYGSNAGLAVTCYSTLNIYFYEWDGSTMTYLGSAPCPVSGAGSSFGLAYNDFNGNIYWSYRSGTDYHLAEFSFSLNSLSQTSWGAIKTCF